MSGKKERGLSPVLVRARDRFRAWRRKRKRGTRIPEPLWTLSVKLARDEGICRTASVLGLDYYSLKRRMEEADCRQRATGSAFIELPAPPVLGRQCSIELDAGATLRVQLVGYDAADVAVLARSVWNGG